MDYIETTIDLKDSDIDSEIIIAELAEIGYESFITEANIIKAFIPKPDFVRDDLNIIINLDIIINEYNLKNVSSVVIKRENWNRTWESNYEPIIVDDFCYIRATFHQPLQGFEQELVIEPKMSFGTGHHQTTRLMIQAMRTIDFEKKSVLDIGCGTGILAILAGKMGASSVSAIDIDNWAIENTVENMKLNNIKDVETIVGDASAIKRNYDIILANINRNILLKDMEIYAQHLNLGGRIVLSGFYEQDNMIIIEEASQRKLELVKLFHDDQWSCLVFTKNNL